MGKNTKRLVLKPATVKAILRTCETLTGYPSILALIESLSTFVEEKLPEYRRSLPGYNEALEKDIDKLTAQMAGKKISKQTLNRLLGRDADNPPPDNGNNRQIVKLLDYYVKLNRKPAARTAGSSLYPSFNNTATQKIAERVNNFCSYATCMHMTQGPDSTAYGSKQIGIACFIYTPLEKSPRYKEGLSMNELLRVSNGIWMCPNHARMINAQDSDGRTPEELKKWKKIREDIIKKCLMGILHIKIDVSFLSGDDADRLAGSLVRYLGKSDLLFAGISDQVPAAVLAEAQRAALFTEDILKKADAGTPIAVLALALHKTISYFNTFSLQKKNDPYLVCALYAMRIATGTILLKMVNIYDVSLPAAVRKILPHHS